MITGPDGWPGAWDELPNLCSSAYAEHQSKFSTIDKDCLTIHQSEKVTAITLPQSKDSAENDDVLLCLRARHR
jgi:hypothetical protein